MTQKQNNQARRLDVFDGFKGVLILVIICYYFLQHMVPGGFLAVNFFLLIAGFFTFRHFYTADVKGTPVQLWNYIRTRFERVFFPMLAMMMASITYVVIFDQKWLFNIRNMAVSSLVFVNNYYQIFSNQSYFVQAANPSLFTHLWYISLYVQLIMLTPLLMLLFYSWHKKTTIAANMLLVAAVLSAFSLAYFYHANSDPSGIYYNVLTRGFAFILGGAVGLLFPVYLAPKPMTPKVRNIFNVMGAVSVVISFLMYRFMYGTQPFAYRFGMTLYTLISLVLMLAAMHPDTLWNKVFSFKLFTFFGKRSLSYYLWFYPVHLVVPQKLASLIGQNLTISLTVQFLLIMLLSEISYRMFERKQWSLPFGQDFNWKKMRTQMRYLKEHKGALMNIKLFSGLYMLTLIVGTVGIAISPESRNNDASNLQKVIEDNQKIAESTRTSAVQEARVINNVEGLAQEEMLYANALDVTFVGDSILAATTSEIQKVFPKAVIDAKEGRHLYQSLDIITGLKSQELLRPTTITILGSNSTFTMGQLNDYIEAVGTDREHFFVTSSARKEWVADANQQLVAASQRYGNVKVIDWANYSNDRSEWFYEDGIHPNEVGALELAKYIATQVYIQR